MPVSVRSGVQTVCVLRIGVVQTCLNSVTILAVDKIQLNLSQKQFEHIRFQRQTEKWNVVHRREERPDWIQKAKQRL